ncbi:MAG: hypothetical protein AAF805_01145 [Planctomycetota bacterium]
MPSSAFQTSFERGCRPLSDRAFGVAATLLRGPAASETFTVVIEDRDYDVEDGEGFTTAIRVRDLLFGVGAAVIDGEAVMPQSGDRIALTEGATESVYELAPAAGRPAVEREPSETRVRCHTKRVG